jgi:hypothetical protein
MKLRYLVVPAFVLLVLLVLLVVFRTPRLWDFFYYYEARTIEELAAEIEGVADIETYGNEDITFEDIGLALTYHGEPIHFSLVTSQSFDDVRHLKIGQVGTSDFVVRGFEEGYVPTGADDDWSLLSGMLDFGPDGDIGATLDPPIRSIPEFLRRLDEVRRIVDGIPTTPPGIRIAAGADERHKWLWVYRRELR